MNKNKKEMIFRSMLMYELRKKSFWEEKRRKEKKGSDIPERYFQIHAGINYFAFNYELCDDLAVFIMMYMPF